MTSQSIAILEKALLSKGDQAALDKVRKNAAEIVAAIEAKDFQLRREAMKAIDEDPQWLAEVYEALSPASGEQDKGIRSFTEEIDRLVETEDKEIGHAFAESLMQGVAELANWQEWFEEVKLEEEELRELRAQPIVEAGRPYAEGMIRYGLTPGIVFEASEGLSMLFGRLKEQADLKDDPRSSQELVDLLNKVRSRTREQKSLVFGVLAESQQNDDADMIVVPRSLLLAEIENTPQLPANAARPLLRWMAKVAQRKSGFVRGYASSARGPSGAAFRRRDDDDSATLYGRWQRMEMDSSAPVATTKKPALV